MAAPTSMKILTPGLRLILAIACLFIIIGGLRYAGSFLIPVILAFFLAALNMPFIGWLHRRGLHHLLAVILTVLVNLSILSVFVGLTVNAMMDFLPKAPTYAEEMRAHMEEWGNKVFEAPILTKTDQRDDPSPHPAVHLRAPHRKPSSRPDRLTYGDGVLCFHHHDPDDDGISPHAIAV